MRYNTDDYYDENDDYGESYSKRTDSIVGKVLLWVVLTPVLLALLAAGTLFCILTFSRFPVGELDEALNRPPLPMEQRYAFHGENRTVDIRIDRADLLFLAQQPEEPFNMDLIRTEASKYGLAINAYDVAIVPGGVQLSMEATAFGLVPLPLMVEAEVTAEETDVIVNISRIWLTKRVSMTPRQLMALLEQPYNETDFNLRITGTEIHPRLAQMTSLRFEQGGATVTCSLGAEEFSEAVPAAEEFRDMLRYMDLDAPMQMVLAAQKKQDPSYVGDAFNGVMTRCQQDPAAYTDFRTEVLGCAKKEQRDAYFAAVTPVVRAWFLPGLTEEAAERKAAEIRDTYQKRQQLYGQLSKRLYEEYLSGGLVNGHDGFLARDGETPFTLSCLQGEDWETDYAPWLDQQQAYPVFIANPPEAVASALPAVEDMPHADERALFGLKNSKPYGVGLALTWKTGAHKLLFWNGTTQEEMDLTPEQFAAWQQEKRIPVLDYIETLHPELMQTEEETDDSED